METYFEKAVMFVCKKVSIVNFRKYQGRILKKIFLVYFLIHFIVPLPIIDLLHKYALSPLDSVSFFY